MATSLLFALTLAASAATPAAKADQPSVAPAPKPACSAAEHRQFDFWVGDWIVTRPDTGAELGRNTISHASGGCLLREHWRGGSGFEGHSLNAYDRQRGAWMQVWVGADGTVLRLEGGLRDGAMVLQGELPKAGGSVQRQRISWTPAQDGSVSQHWQVSDDDGGRWKTSFLGVYRRAGGVPVEVDQPEGDQASGEPGSGEARSKP